VRRPRGACSAVATPCPSRPTCGTASGRSALAHSGRSASTHRRGGSSITKTVDRPTPAATGSSSRGWMRPRPGGQAQPPRCA